MAAKTAVKPVAGKPAAKPASTAVATQADTKKAVTASVKESLLLEDAQESQQFNVDDIALPRLIVLQSNSPQVTKGHELYQKGLKAGMLFNTATSKGYEAEAEDEDGDKHYVLVIPAYFTPSYLEWALREAGGGLKKDHGPDGSLMGTTTQDEKRRNILPNGNQLDRNALYFCLHVTDEEAGQFEQAALSLRSTQLKKSKRWNSLIMGLTADVGGQKIKPAMFYQAYKISTIPEKNSQGNWFGVKIEYGPKVLDLPNGEQMYLAARAFMKAASGGKVKVKQDAPAEEVVTDAEIEDGGGHGDEDDEVPF